MLPSGPTENLCLRDIAVKLCYLPLDYRVTHYLMIKGDPIQLLLTHTLLLLEASLPYIQESSRLISSSSGTQLGPARIAITETQLGQR